MPQVGFHASEAVWPLTEHVEDNGNAIREMMRVLSHLGRRIEDRLQDERQHLDESFRQHSDFMANLAEARLQQLLRKLEAVHTAQLHTEEAVRAVQRQAAEGAVIPGASTATNRTAPDGATVELDDRREEASPPSSLLIATALAPMEASLSRIEAALQSPEPGPPKNVPDCRRTAFVGFTPAAGSSGNGSVEAAVGDKTVKLETVGNDSTMPELERSEEEEEEETCADFPKASASMSPGYEEPEWKQDMEKLSTTASPPMDAAVWMTREFFMRRASESSGAPQEVTRAEDCESLLGLQYEELVHWHNTTKSMPQKMLSQFVLKYIFPCWSQLKEPPRTSRLARFIASGLFEAVCAMVIIANMIFIALIAPSREHDTIQVGETIFLGWYTMEVSLKMIVHRAYFFFGDEMKWNIFDLFLVVTDITALALTDKTGSKANADQSRSVSDTTVLRSLRILKMAKILRVVRIMRVVSDLRVMMNSVIGSSLSLFWSFVMLAFVYFLFGLVFHQSLSDYMAEHDAADIPRQEEIISHFGTLGDSMMSLFKATSSGNDWDFYFGIIAPSGWLNCAIFVFFIGFVQISIMNIITALFVERAMHLAQPDSAAQARKQRLKERCEAQELRRMCRQMDTNQSGTISAQEFRTHLQSSELKCLFSVLGLDIRNAQEFFEMLVFTSDGNEVDIESFVQGCLRMRGPATGIAQQSLLIESRLLRRAQHETWKYFHRKLDDIAQKLPM